MFKINSVYKFLLIILFLASVVTTGWVIYSLDPNENVNNVVLFYISSGFAVLFTVALLLYVFRQRFGVREMAKRHFVVSLRQGFLVGLCFAIALFLQSQELFTWLNSAFLVAALTFLEIYFLYSERKNINTNLSPEDNNA